LAIPLLGERMLGKPEEKRQLGRPRYRWVENNEIDLREIGWGGIYWTDLTQDRDLPQN
jgi:hypothetical protein